MTMHPDTRAALLAAIRTEITTDPTARGYAGTAAQMAALMAAPIVTPAPTRHRDVSISDVEGYLRARLLVTRLRSWATTAQPGTAKEAALELLDIIASPRLSMFTTSTETGRANVMNLFASLVAATSGVVTQQHHDDLLAMTVAPADPPTVSPSRWSVLIAGRAGAPNAPDKAMIAEALA